MHGVHGNVSQTQEHILGVLKGASKLNVLLLLFTVISVRPVY